MRWLLAALFALPMAAADPVRLLILTGQHDKWHDWRSTTALLEDALKRTGRFEVRVTEEPRGLTADALRDYDALLVNYNGPRLPAASEKAIAEFVRSGKGLASFHAVTYGPWMGNRQKPDNSWELVEGWADWSDLVGVTWPTADIGHAPRGAFTVKVADATHAIATGMPAEWTVSDELYHKQVHKPGNAVVTNAFSDKAIGGTGKVEPIAWTRSFGNGRVFHTSLGHDAAALYHPNTLGLIARGAEWAATGSVTIPAEIGPRTISKNAARVLVVTGGHSYDPSFYQLFRTPEIRWQHATSQKEAFKPDMAKRFDVLVLHDMQNEIGEAEAANLRAYVEAGKGVVSIHHSIVDYTSWPWWHEQVIGGKYHEKPTPAGERSTFKEGVWMTVRPVRAQAKHPILSGVADIVTDDECYAGMWHSPKNTVLMETDAACADKPVVWIGPNPEKARAVYIQIGHDTHTHLHPAYQRLVHNAIAWAAQPAQQ